MSLTEFEKDLLTTTGEAETVYRWEAVYNGSAKPTEAYYRPYDDEDVSEDSSIFIY